MNTKQKRAESVNRDEEKRGKEVSTSTSNSKELTTATTTTYTSPTQIWSTYIKFKVFPFSCVIVTAPQSNRQQLTHCLFAFCFIQLSIRYTNHFNNWFFIIFLFCFVFCCCWLIDQNMDGKVSKRDRELRKKNIYFLLRFFFSFTPNTWRETPFLLLPITSTRIDV